MIGVVTHNLVLTWMCRCCAGVSAWQGGRARMNPRMRLHLLFRTGLIQMLPSPLGRVDRGTRRLEALRYSRLETCATTLLGRVDRGARRLEALRYSRLETCATMFCAIMLLELGRCCGQAQGLVGYWKFDEGKTRVAADSSGNGNNG